MTDFWLWQEPGDVLSHSVLVHHGSRPNDTPDVRWHLEVGVQSLAPLGPQTSVVSADLTKFKIIAAGLRGEPLTNRGWLKTQKFSQDHSQGIVSLWVFRVPWCQTWFILPNQSLLLINIFAWPQYLRYESLSCSKHWGWKLVIFCWPCRRVQLWCFDFQASNCIKLPLLLVKVVHLSCNVFLAQEQGGLSASHGLTGWCLACIFGILCPGHETCRAVHLHMKSVLRKV